MVINLHQCISASAHHMAASLRPKARASVLMTPPRRNLAQLLAITIGELRRCLDLFHCRDG